MSLLAYSFQRGETISLPLYAAQGDSLSVSAIEAKLRKLAPGKRTLDPDTPVAATFAVSAREATVDVPAGWTFTIDAAASAALAGGLYLADARMVVASGVVVTHPVMIQIEEPATT